jgi:hypothetical protein
MVFKISHLLTKYTHVNYSKTEHYNNRHLNFDTDKKKVRMVYDLWYFNATFNNISVISRQVSSIGGGNHRPVASP